jgi:hypothetical protein
MEMQQTYCYTTVTIMLLYKRYQRLNMSQYEQVVKLRVANTL